MPKLKPGVALPRHKPYADMTLDDVRAEVAKVREAGLKIQSHYKHLEKLYEEWEDDLIKVERMIDQVRDDTGLSREEIIIPEKPQDDILEDLGIG